MKQILSLAIAAALSSTMVIVLEKTGEAHQCLSDSDCPTPNACVTQAHCVRPFEEGKVNTSAVSHANPRGIERAGICRFSQKKHCCLTDSDCVIAGDAGALTCVKESHGKKTQATDAGKCRAVSAVKDTGPRAKTSPGKQTTQGKKTEAPTPVPESNEVSIVSEKIKSLLDTGEPMLMAEKETNVQTGESEFNITLLQKDAQQDVINGLEIGTANIESIEKLSVIPNLAISLETSREDSTVIAAVPNSIFTTENTVLFKLSDQQLSLTQDLLRSLTIERAGATTNSQPEKTPTTDDSTDKETSPSEQE